MKDYFTISYETVTNTSLLLEEMEAFVGIRLGVSAIRKPW